MKTETAANPRSKAFEEATKLWQILEIALEDLAACENDPVVVVHMGEWYHELGPHRCHVCLAGAVMRQSLDRRGLTWLVPNSFAGQDGLPTKLAALDKLRRGLVKDACYIMFGTFRSPVFDCWIADYHKNKEEWWVDIGKLLADLKEADL